MCLSLDQPKDQAPDEHLKDPSLECLHRSSNAARFDRGEADEGFHVASYKGPPVLLNWFDNQPTCRKCRTESIAASCRRDRPAVVSCAIPIATSCTADRKSTRLNSSHLVISY